MTGWRWANQQMAYGPNSLANERNKIFLPSYERSHKYFLVCRNASVLQEKSGVNSEDSPGRKKMSNFIGWEVHEKIINSRVQQKTKTFFSNLTENACSLQYFCALWLQRARASRHPSASRPSSYSPATAVGTELAGSAAKLDSTTSISSTAVLYIHHTKTYFKISRYSRI